MKGLPCLAEHLIGVAVVGRDERRAALALESGQHLGHARIHRLDGGHGGRDDARMAPTHVRGSKFTMYTSASSASMAAASVAATSGSLISGFRS